MKHRLSNPSSQIPIPPKRPVEKSWSFWWQITLIKIPQVLVAPHFADGVRFGLRFFYRMWQYLRSFRNELASVHNGGYFVRDPTVSTARGNHAAFRAAMR